MLVHNLYIDPDLQEEDSRVDLFQRLYKEVGEHALVCAAIRYD